MPGRTVPGDNLLRNDPHPDTALVDGLVLVVVAGTVAEVAAADGAAPLQLFAPVGRRVAQQFHRAGDQDAAQLIAVFRD